MDMKMGHSYLYCSALLLGHLLALDVEGLGADLLGHLTINIVINIILVISIIIMHLVACFMILAVLDRDPGAAGLGGSVARRSIGRLKI